MAASNVLAENRQAWGNVVLKAGQNPYRHEVFSAFLPVAPVAQGTQAPLPLGPACSKLMPGMMICFTGKTIARKTPSTRLVDRFLGKVQTPKVLTLGDSFKHHQAQLDILELTETRKEAETQKHQALLRKQAMAASSAAALKRASTDLGERGGGGGGGGSKRTRPAAVGGATHTMDSFVSRESKAFPLAQAQIELEASLSRLACGCVI